MSATISRPSTPLSRRVRVRLAATSVINGIAYRLCRIGLWRVARVLYRACGMWKSS